MFDPDPGRALAYGLFSLQQAMAAGMSQSELRRGIRRGAWERIGRGVLQEAGRQSRPGDDVVLALLQAGPGAVLAGESAAAVYGWDLLDPPVKPRIIVPRHGRGDYRTSLAPAEVTTFGIIAITSPVRTVIDMLCELDAEAAVVAADSALRSGMVRVDELQRAFDSSRRPGIPKGRKRLTLADPRCGSVPETQARLLLHRAGLPPPVSQFQIRVDGQVFRADFAWEAVRLIAEIDGFAHHSDRAAFQRDRTRQNALVQAGWLVLRFTVDDLRLRPESVVAEVRRALRHPV